MAQTCRAKPSGRADSVRAVEFGAVDQPASIVALAWRAHSRAERRGRGGLLKDTKLQSTWHHFDAILLRVGTEELFSRCIACRGNGEYAEQGGGQRHGDERDAAMMTSQYGCESQ
eukprot:4725569-Pleurochrysis_carterae.AAC.2